MHGRAMLSSLVAAQTISIIWRLKWSVSHASWRHVIHFLLRTMALGLGLAAQTMHIHLDEEGTPPEPPAASGWACVLETFSSLALILFGSMVPLMLIASLAFRLRLR